MFLLLLLFLLFRYEMLVQQVCENMPHKYAICACTVLKWKAPGLIIIKWIKVTGGVNIIGTAQAALPIERNNADE